MLAIYGDDYEIANAEIEWDRLCQEVLDKIVRYKFQHNCQIMRGFSFDVSSEIESGIDTLHIDGNHDYDAVAQDIEDYIPKLKGGGFVALDDIDWEGVAPHYAQLKRTFPVVYEAHNWGIMRKM